MKKTHQSDEELFSGYLHGDASGFEVLFDRYAGPLLGYIQRLVRNRNEAEDILQEVFIKVIKGAESFDASKSFKTWIYTISRNAWIDHLRRSRPEMPSHDIEVKSCENPEILTSVKELSGRLENALTELKPEIREVFLLREKSGMSFKEIAELTGASLNTVLGRMHQALNKLKDAIKETENVS